MKSKVGNRENTWFLIQVFIKHQYFIKKHSITTLGFHIFHIVRGITYIPCFFFCFPLVNHFYSRISLAKPHDLDEGLVLVETEHSILWQKRRVQVKSKIPTVLRGRIKSWAMGKSSAMHLSRVHLGGALSF